MTSGGQSAIVSPMARTIRPSSCAKAATFAPTPWAGSNARFVALSATSLDRADQAESARLADQRMVGERLQARWKCGAIAPHMREDVVALIDFERLERDRRRDRMAGIGEAVAEHADLAALASISASSIQSGMITPPSGM